MAWFWRAQGGPSDPDALAALGFDDAFGSQAEAEAWITAGYAELAEQGVTAVSLYEEDRLVYGPMSLEVD